MLSAICNELFNNTYENNCRTNRGLEDKGKNTVLKKEHKIE